MNCLDVNLDQFGHEHGHEQHDYMHSASQRKNGHKGIKTEQKRESWKRTSTEAGHAFAIRTAIHHFSTSRKFVQSGWKLTLTRLARQPPLIALRNPSTYALLLTKRDR